MSAWRYSLWLNLILAAGKAGAGFDGVWPIYDHPRELREAYAQVWSGTVERCRIAGVAEPAWYTNFGPREITAGVADIKSKLVACIPRFVDHRSVPDAATAAAWLNVSNLPAWTATGLLAVVGRPTNYLAYTPERSVNGTGPFTNDGTVGRPHGWTNSWTVNGGDGFPGARTNWYTTDYDIGGCVAILTNLQMTTGTWEYVSKGAGDWGAGPYQAGSFYAALRAMYDNFAESTTGFEFSNAYYVVAATVANLSDPADGTNLAYLVEGYHASSRLRLKETAWTGTTHQAEFYAVATNYYPGDWATNAFYSLNDYWNFNSVQWLSDSGWVSTNRPVSRNDTARGNISQMALVPEDPYNYWTNVGEQWDQGEGVSTVAGYKLAERGAWC